jgi:23S rRNA (guanosine2251-2'-O)-methyltransferase
MIKLGAKELRLSDPTQDELSKIKRREFYFILDNVLDTYNIGGIFRLADALGVKKIYICGESETPPNHRIKKASINTTEWIDWEYQETAAKAIKKLKSEIPKVKVIAVEQDEKSALYTNINYELPVAFVAGNETAGCSKETLNVCDFTAEIPMFGVNKSMNVIISLGIVSFFAASKLT